MKRFVFFLVLLIASSVCMARKIPLDSLEGQVSPMDYPYIKVNGKPMRLSPGANIYDINNLVILPTRLPASSRAIYQLNSQGHVQKVWLVTPQEFTEFQGNKKRKD